MMDQEMCLKVSYKGMLRYLYCGQKRTYKNIVPLVLRRFSLPTNFTPAVQFTHKSGYIFDEDVFNNFVLLYPRPKVIFYVRLDYIKLATLPSEDSPEMSADRPKTINKHRYSATRSGRDDGGSYATPIFRQNCFYGAYPESSSALHHQQELELSKQYAKRLRTSPISKKMRPKRESSLRI